MSLKKKSENFELCLLPITRPVGGIPTNGIHSVSIKNSTYILETFLEFYYGVLPEDPIYNDQTERSTISFTILPFQYGQITNDKWPQNEKVYLYELYELIHKNYNIHHSKLYINNVSIDYDIKSEYQLYSTDEIQLLLQLYTKPIIYKDSCLQVVLGSQNRNWIYSIQTNTTTIRCQMYWLGDEFIVEYFWDKNYTVGKDFDIFLDIQFALNTALFQYMPMELGGQYLKLYILPDGTRSYENLYTSTLNLPMMFNYYQTYTHEGFRSICQISNNKYLRLYLLFTFTHKFYFCKNAESPQWRA